MTLPLLLTDREAAALLGIGRSTLWRWSDAGDLPAPVRLGGSTRWRRADLEAAAAALGNAVPPAPKGHARAIVASGKASAVARVARRAHAA